MTLTFLTSVDEESKLKIVTAIRDNFEKWLTLVCTSLVEKEGQPDNQKMIESFVQMYGSNTKRLSFRILDELLSKEQKATQMKDFTQIIKKEIFQKSVFVCAIECVFFIAN